LYVRKLRGRHDIGEEHLENVIHFHKSLHFDAEGVSSGLPGIRSIKDVNRFNFSYFLDHLDDPVKNISVYGDDEGPATIAAPKVYHLNLVLRMTNGSEGQFAHYRVILDKQGLVRLEGAGRCV